MSNVYKVYLEQTSAALAVAVSGFERENGDKYKSDGMLNKSSPVQQLVDRTIARSGGTESLHA